MPVASTYLIVLYCVKDGKTTKKSFRSYHAAREYEREVLDAGGACFWQVVA